MIRDKMIKIILDRLWQNLSQHCNLFPEDFENIANQILTDLEQNGMLPPQHPTKEELTIQGNLVPVNEWEDSLTETMKFAIKKVKW